MCLDVWETLEIYIYEMCVLMFGRHWREREMYKVCLDVWETQERDI